METNFQKRIMGFVCTSDPMNDRAAWSGTPYKMREAIENAGFEVRWIKIQPNKILYKLFFLVFSRILRIRHLELSNIYGYLHARSACIDDIMDCDSLLLFFDWRVVKYLKRRVPQLPPLIYYSDTSYRLMVDYYWFNIPEWINHQADSLEQYAISSSKLVIKSSEWALNGAIKDYGCSKKKAVVIEFGANIDEKDIVTAEPYCGGELRVLFSGLEWKRKGCGIAIETVQKLNENGINAKLFLVGINKNTIPSKYQNIDSVEYVGYLNKNNPQEYTRYVEVVRNCHCLLLPTHAECSAIVFSEAAAFGLPSFTYDTGGLSNYVVNGKTGYRLDINSTADDFANAIMSSIVNDEFEKLQSAALAMYREKLSWMAWSSRFADVIKNNLY